MKILPHDGKYRTQEQAIDYHNKRKEKLRLRLHPNKSKILLLCQGILFLGYRNFAFHRLLRKSNIRNMVKQTIKRDYDSLCVYLEGWIAYAKFANTFRLRRRISRFIELVFPGNISLLQIDRLR